VPAAGEALRLGPESRRSRQRRADRSPRRSRRPQDPDREMFRGRAGGIPAARQVPGDRRRPRL